MKSPVRGVPLSGRVFPCIILFLPILGFSQTPVTRVWTHWTTASTSRSYIGTGATGNFASGLTGNTYTYQFGPAVAIPNTLLLDSFVA